MISVAFNLINVLAINMFYLIFTYIHFSFLFFFLFCKTGDGVCVCAFGDINRDEIADQC